MRTFQHGLSTRKNGQGQKGQVHVLYCHVLLATTAVALAALYFAVLRGRRPQATARTHTRLNDFTVNPPKLDLSLAVEVTMRNPNHARFRYSEVVMTVTYHNTTAGRATAPVGAPVQVDADKVIMHTLYSGRPLCSGRSR
jgi:hypothetical protein